MFPFQPLNDLPLDSPPSELVPKDWTSLRGARLAAAAAVKAGTFHDLRKTAITNWFYQELNIYDVMRLAGHSKYETTYRFYLEVKDGLLDRARRAITHTVSRELLQKCCSRVSGGDNEKGRQA